MVCRNLLETAIHGNHAFLFRRLTDEVLEDRDRITWDLFKCLMKSCKHFKDLNRAKDVFSAFIWHQGHKDTRCINTLLSVYKDTGEFPPLKKSFGLFEKLGVRPDCFTVGVLLKCAYNTKQPIEVIDQILEEARDW